MPTRNKISVLILDDNPTLVQLYKSKLEKFGNLQITSLTDSENAFRLAQKQLFDVLVIDAKLYYRGNEFGGLKLADSLKNRYGCNSILIISKFITPELMKEHGSYFDFLEKQTCPRVENFIQTLAAKIEKLYKRQFFFIAMPFCDSLSFLYVKIKKIVKELNFKCVRIDEVKYGKNIHEVLFEHIGKSKLVIFIADQGNPNAYFEAGFASALDKEVVIIAKSKDELKFDIENKQTIFYDKNRQFTSLLKNKINSLRLESPFI